ncbi:MAG: caspase family protein [Gemmatimonadota bacterium]
MNIRRVAVGFISLAVALSTAPAQRTGTSQFSLPGRNVALLIGTDLYSATREWARLSSPVLDATTIARSLAGDFRFDTTVVRNATKDEVIRAIVDHGKRATSADDWSLVFIAAHGYFDDDRSQGYLVFRDSRPRDSDVSRSSYLSLTELRGIVEGFRAGHVLLVIDACYAGTIDPDIRFGTDRSERTTSGDITSSLLRRSQYKSRIYLTSGGKEYVPDGRPGAHSPFAASLLGALREASSDGRALTFSQIVGYMAERGLEPLPRHNVFRGHEPGGDFVLVPRSFSASAPARPMVAVDEPAPTRGSVNPAPSRPPPPRPSSVAGRQVVLRVEVTAGRDNRSDAADARAAVASRVHAALVERGFSSIHQAAAGSVTTGACAGRQARCVTVTLRVTPTIANNRQTVDVSYLAVANDTEQTLAAETGRAGPFAMDVPSNRVVERAVDSKLSTFLDALVAGLQR